MNSQVGPSLLKLDSILPAPFSKQGLFETCCLGALERSFPQSFGLCLLNSKRWLCPGKSSCQLPLVLQCEQSGNYTEPAWHCMKEFGQGAERACHQSPLCAVLTTLVATLQPAPQVQHLTFSPGDQDTLVSVTFQSSPGSFTGQWYSLSHDLPETEDRAL